TPTRVFATVQVRSDTKVEGDEQFEVHLSSPTPGFVVGDGTGVGTIIDDDPAAGLRVGAGDVTTPEGNGGQPYTVRVPVTLSAPATSAVTVSYQVVAGTAGPDDFSAPTTIRKLRFAPGEYHKFVDVTIDPDRTAEPDETVLINITGASGATPTRTT